MKLKHELRSCTVLSFSFDKNKNYVAVLFLKQYKNELEDAQRSVANLRSKAKRCKVSYPTFSSIMFRTMQLQMISPKVSFSVNISSTIYQKKTPVHHSQAIDEADEHAALISQIEVTFLESLVTARIRKYRT